MLGITSAGEGITFMMLWTFAGQFGLLGTDYTFQKAVSALMRGLGCLIQSSYFLCNPHLLLFPQVFYTSFFPVFCSPPILWAARSPPTTNMSKTKTSKFKHTPALPSAMCIIKFETFDAGTS